MLHLRFWCLVCSLVLLPQIGEAAVTIHEVAWMGSSASANHEWIELYNDGGSESVDGWTLSDGMNLAIALSGTISAGSYAVLERTSDDSAPGTAFLLYTGALVNTGATLTLRRADGTIADQVSGGENWSSIGGDNVTKETAQYTSGGWVTAISTPGAQNTTDTNNEEETEEEEEQEESDEDDTNGTGSDPVTKTRTATKEPVKLEPSTPTVAISMPGQVYVNQEVAATAKVSNIGEVLAQSMVRSWNFGDLHTATGEEVTHRFAYPGEYIVSVTAAYKNFVAKDRVVVTVLPLTLSVTKNAAGDVQLHNDSKYEVDVSGHTVLGERSVTIPLGTFLRPKATLTIPRAELLHTDRPILVYDSARRLVAHSGEQQTEALPMVTAPKTMAVAQFVSEAAHAPTPMVQAAAPFRFGVSAPTTTNVAGVATNTTLVTREAAIPVGPASLQASAPGAAAAPLYPYLGLIAVLCIALAAVVAGRVPTPAEETISEYEAEPNDFPFR